MEGRVFADFALQDSERGENSVSPDTRGAVYEEAGVSFGGDEVVYVREKAEDRDHVFLHDRGRRLACESQDVVGGEGRSAPASAEEGDRGFGPSVLANIGFDLLEERAGVPSEGFGEGDPGMSSLPADDPRGCCGRLWSLWPGASGLALGDGRAWAIRI